MTPIEPQHLDGGFLVVFGREQKEYTPLPASVRNDGTVITEWELTEEEREILFMGGRVVLRILKPLDQPLNPVQLSVVEADE